MSAGIGTHIDAPAHCIPGGVAISDLPLSKLIAPCVVLDVSKSSNENYMLPPDEILTFEKRYGKIESNTIVFVYTSWDRYWNDPIKYRNDLKFPTISEESALLLAQRKISALGIDTLGIDLPSSGYPAHRILLGSGVFIIENVASLSQMPTRGGTALCLPLKGEGLTEAPARLIGLKP